MGLKTKLIFDEELNSYYELVKAEFEDFLKIEIAKESKEMAPLIEKGVLGGKMLRPVLFLTHWMEMPTWHLNVVWH